MSTNPKVVHLSSVHDISDTRVFHKECVSLARNGFDVTLVINADFGRNAEDQVVQGVRVRSLRPRLQSRLSRMTSRVLEVWTKAFAEHADLYHLHDPELIPVGILLKLSGAHIVYDAHEHVAKQIRTKKWIPRLLRYPASIIYRAVEWLAAKMFFDAVVVADPTQASLYPSQKVTVVENYPILGEGEFASNRTYESRPDRVTYVGGLTELRGVLQMVQAIEIVNRHRPAMLSLAGRFSPPSLLARAEVLDGWHYTDYVGFLDRRDVFGLLAESRIGIVVLHPIPNYLTSQPVKLLEYMLAGIPVVVCDFPYYRQYVEGAGCGLMVDPLSPLAIAEAIQWLLDHTEEAKEMGERGRLAVLQRYNWDHEAAKLISLYQRLLENIPS